MMGVVDSPILFVVRAILFVVTAMIVTCLAHTALQCASQMTWAACSLFSPWTACGLLAVIKFFYHFSAEGVATEAGT